MTRPVAVVGATGRIGVEVVAALRARGIEVTAYVRSPDKIPPEWGGAVRVVVGDLDDTARLDAAIVGARAVISALGPVVERKDLPAPLVEGTRAVLAAMRRAGLRRYVGLATPSVRDPLDRFAPTAALPVLLVRVALPRAYASVVGMTREVTTSDLDWTVVRYLRLVDGPAKGVRRVGPVGGGVGSAVTRADVARFVVEQLDSDEWLYALPQVSN